MIDDSILREIRAFRDELAERFKDDPQGFHAWIKSREEESSRGPNTRVARSEASRTGNDTFRRLQLQELQIPSNLAG